MTRVAARLVIEGRVQGVGYRWWAVEMAHRLELVGWVRNRADGSVEALAIGAAEALEQFAIACRRGPQHAAVRAVAVTPADDDGSTDFAQWPTL
jgi:acylphosphatase